MSKIHLIPDLNKFKEFIELAQSYDVAFEYNDFFNPKLLDDEKLLKERVTFYKNIQRDRSLDSLHGAFYDLAINSMDSKVADLSKKRMYQSMEIAKSLGVKSVIFHTNIISGFRNKSYLDNWLEKTSSFIEELSSKYSQNIYIENMFDDSPLMLKELSLRLSDCDQYGVCFDIAHARLSETSLDKWFDELHPFIKHLHINDNDGISDLHNSVGVGVIDWKGVVAELDRYKINSSVLVEVTGLEKQKQSLEFMLKNNICLKKM